MNNGANEKHRITRDICKENQNIATVPSAEALFQIVALRTDNNDQAQIRTMSP